MSYDLEHVQKECSCPCGKGKIVYGWGTNDWNQVREGMEEILCGECSKKYRIVKDGLLPKSFPKYEGDVEAYDEMNKIHDIINNYCGSHCFNYWSDELREKRIHLYLTDEEIKEDEKNGKHENLDMALSFSKELADEYTFEELKDTQMQLLKCKYSTQLVGIANDIVEKHKRQYKSVKLSKVIVPVNMAIRNYNHYKESDLEDEEYINKKREELKQVESIYYKGFDEYEENRVKHLIPYKLVDVKR